MLACAGLAHVRAAFGADRARCCADAGSGRRGASPWLAAELGAVVDVVEGCLILHESGASAEEQRVLLIVAKT